MHTLYMGYFDVLMPIRQSLHAHERSRRGLYLRPYPRCGRLHRRYKLLFSLSDRSPIKSYAALAKALGCDFSKEKKGGEKDGKKGDGGVVVPPPLNRTLPRVMVDGPFGSASEDFFKVWSLNNAFVDCNLTMLTVRDCAARWCGYWRHSFRVHT